ncbi:MAG TPA: VWA domain-containing protein [Anaerolineaceae bacterium]|jgi:hypothetical protein
MRETGGKLFDNMLLFGRLLRELGLDVDSGRMIDLTKALGTIEIGQRVDFYHTLRCMLVHRREDLPLFDQAFARFWRNPLDAAQEGRLTPGGELRRSRRPIIVPPPLKPNQIAPPTDHTGQAGRENEPPLVEATLTYSQRELLRRKDFSDLSGEELEAIQRMIAGLTWQLGRRRSRRFQAGDGRLLDLRRTLRGNFRYGGEVVAWSHRETKDKPRALVILADISGSMERYTRLLLHFIYSASRGMESNVEAFVFSTRLTRITRPLRERSVDQALREVSRNVPDWSGGTRIGEALKEFNFNWARRVLGHGAVVLLISDGWDRGDPILLRGEIARLQRSCYRLIWLNPLLAAEDYEPLARGMQTALPYIDDFLPVHNLANLEDLAGRLRRIDENRPVRRQTPRAAESVKP